MKTIKDIIELYKPKSADEDRFFKKHVIKKTEDANGNKDDLFNGSKIKPINREPNHGYNPGEDEKVYESYSDPKHFKFLRHLQKAGIPAPSKDRAMELIARHGDPDRAGQAFVKRYKLIKNAANKVQKENVELDEVLDSPESKKKYLDKVLSRPGRPTLFGNDPKEKRRFKPGGYVSKVSNRLYLQQYEEVEPEGEELNELSKETLKSYTQKAAFPANPSTVHTPQRAKRVKGLIKATNKLYLKQYEEVEPEGKELDEAKTKKSPIEKLYNRPSMQFAKKYTKKSAHEIKMERLGFPTRHLPKDETDTETTSSLEGEAKQKAIEKIASRTMQKNSYELEGDQFNELILNPFFRGLLETTHKCKECGKSYKGKSCSCCMKESSELEESISFEKYKITSEPGNGGWRPVIREKGTNRSVYIGQHIYGKSVHAKQHAKTFLNAAYASNSWKAGHTAGFAYAKENKDKLVNTTNEEIEQVNEILEPSMGAKAYIDDFLKSSRFRGTPKKQVIKQALAAYYAAKRGK